MMQTLFEKLSFYISFGKSLAPTLCFSLCLLWSCSSEGRRERAWAAAQDANSREAYQQFLNRFGGGPEAGLARWRLDSLETASWEAALQSGKTDQLLAYLQDYPEGAYQAEARERIDSAASRARRGIPDFGFWWQVVDRAVVVIVQGGQSPFSFALTKGGQTIRSLKDNTSGVVELSLSGLAAGPYGLQVQDAGGARKSDTFILQRSYVPKPEAEEEETPEGEEELADDEREDARAGRRPVFLDCEKRNARREESCTERKIRDFIEDRLRYPEEARAQSIEGTVQVEFIVGKDGFVTNARALNDIGGNCAAEARRVVSQLPRFKPGSNADGEAVSVRIVVPVVFKKRRF